MNGFRSVFLLIPVALVCAQQPDKPPERGSIEGQVVNALTGEPVRKAQILAQRSDGGGSNAAAVSDGGGHFLVKDVTPGQYNISAERNGYVNSARRRGQRSDSISVSPGQQVRDVVIKLTPHGVVTGRVVDEDGEPLQFTSILLSGSNNVRGERRQFPAGSAVTNDLGEYRVFGVAPGRYYLSARYNENRNRFAEDRSPVKEADEGYAPTYYPGTNDPAGAVAIAVTAGQELHGINLVLRKVRTLRVRGRVVNTVSGRTNRNLRVMLVPRDGPRGGFFGQFGAMVRDPNGSFDIRGVPPGSYTAMAMLFSDGKQFMARQPVEVGSSNVDNVSLTLAPGVELKGQVRVESQTQVPLEKVRVMLRLRNPGPFGGRTNEGQVTADGSFVLSDVSPDTYNLAIRGAPDTVYVKSIRMGDQDGLESGLDLTRGGVAGIDVLLAGNAGQIDGTAVNAHDQPASGVLVVLVPDERHRQQTSLFKFGTTDTSGHFTMTGIAPGEYKLFAWEDNEAVYDDPEFLKPFENRGESISIREGSRETKQLKIIPADETSPGKLK